MAKKKSSASEQPQESTEETATTSDEQSAQDSTQQQTEGEDVISKQGKSSERLKSAMEEVQGKFGKESVMKLGDIKNVDVEATPTGSISLDYALGVGGVPRGRIVELYGPESSGKTTIALQIVARDQAQGGAVAFVDTEHGLDPSYAQKLGVNTDDLLISQPNTGEEALNIVETLVRTGNLDLVVIDSVAALVPKAEIEGEMGDQQVALQARLMSQALRKLTAITAKARTSIIFTNQTRMKIGTMGYGSPVDTPGGKSLKFYASVRIEIKRIAQIKKGEEVIGSRTRAKVVKNKVAPPFQTAEFDIMYNEGVSYEADLINLAVKAGILQKKGAYIKYGDQNVGQGNEAARQAVKEDPEFANTLYQKIMESPEVLS
ncbi:MAG: recombinase RecA [Parcubacteria group bacterium SW_4_49_11]|nr:MAG: recombinase RecA [Parcubacteria group bacterium SW_4_49_11]